MSRSTSTSFDATPAAVPHFHHTLLELLLSLSKSVKRLWSRHEEEIFESNYKRKLPYANGNVTRPQMQFVSHTKVLDSIASHFRAGRADSVCPPQWNSFLPAAAAVHTRDPWRAMSDYYDCFGIPAEEKGPSREWYNQPLEGIVLIVNNE